MKKVLLPLIAAGLAAALIYSCSKETPMITERFDTATEEPDVSRLILNFIERMEARNEGLPFKSEEKISVDSAVWYIDATLNLTYAQANYPFFKAQWDTVYAEMPVLANKEVNISDVFDTYDATLRGLSEKYHAIEEENKQFMMALVEDMGAIGGNKHKVRLISITGTGILEHKGDFGVEEAYLWNRDATENCNWDPAPGAPIIFEAKLNNHYNPDPPNNCRWYFYGATDLVEYEYENYQLNTTLTNYLDYKIYAASEYVNEITDETKCLEYGQDGGNTHEMQFYYDHLKDLIDEWLASGNNTNNKKYTPKSEISSITQTLPFLHIYHEPKIQFRKRGLTCEIAVIIPEFPIE